MKANFFLVSAMVFWGCGNGKKNGEIGPSPGCALLGIDCNNKDGSKPERPMPTIEYGTPGFSLTSERFDSCDDLQHMVRERLAAHQKEDLRFREWQQGQWAKIQNSTVASDGRSMPAPAVVSDSSASVLEGGSSSGTNVQENGIDESDFVKIGLHHIFVTQVKGVKVVDRSNYQVLGELPTEGLVDVELYADQGQLIVTGTVSLAGQRGDTQDFYSSWERQENVDTEIRVYSTPEHEIPQLKKSIVQSGKLVDTRFIDGRLLLILSRQLPISAEPVYRKNSWRYGAAWPFESVDLSAELTDHPVDVDENGKILGVRCDSIVRPQANDFDFRMTEILIINTRDPEVTQNAAAMIGGGDQIYMSKNALYIAKSNLSWFWWDEQREKNQNMAITKFEFDAVSGEILARGGALIQGHAKDQWAFKEYSDSGVLAVATSTGILWSQAQESIAQNHLWLLKENANRDALELSVAIHNFGTGEDIRSVRFVDRMAYIVTFKKTDPLFAFDLSNLEEPKLLGELKIPGFSTYMHPVADGRMLGVGFDALDQGNFAYFQGIQVSLFDVSNPIEMKRIDQKIIGTRGSSSEVTGNHHAFFFDAQSGLVAIPATELSGGGGWAYGSTLEFSGAILYRVKDKIEEVGRISHQDAMPEQCLRKDGYGQWWQDTSRSADINRAFKIDGNLVTISRFALKVRNFDEGLAEGNWNQSNLVVNLDGGVLDCAR